MADELDFTSSNKQSWLTFIYSKITEYVTDLPDLTANRVVREETSCASNE